MQEIWKPIDGYEGLYEVSNHGNVRSLDRYVMDKGNPSLTKAEEHSAPKQEEPPVAEDSDKSGEKKPHHRRGNYHRRRRGGKSGSAAPKSD